MFMVNNIALINMKSYSSDARLRYIFVGLYYIKDLLQITLASIFTNVWVWHIYKSLAKQNF